MSKLDELIIELIKQDELDGYYGDKISDVAKEYLKAFMLELIGELEYRETMDMALQSWDEEDFKAFGRNELRIELSKKVKEL